MEAFNTEKRRKSTADSCVNEAQPTTSNFRFPAFSRPYPQASLPAPPTGWNLHNMAIPQGTEVEGRERNKFFVEFKFFTMTRPEAEAFVGGLSSTAQPEEEAQKSGQ